MSPGPHFLSSGSESAPISSPVREQMTNMHVLYSVYIVHTAYPLQYVL